MYKREKEVLQHQLDAEKAVLAELKKQYQRALDDINIKIRILQSDELTQSKIYQLEYQKVLRSQVTAILEKLHGDEYSTIQKYLSESYTDAFIGTVYAMHGQGVPLILPIDQNAAVKAVMTDSKIKEGLYKSLGVDVNKLKKSISAEITRGIASGLSLHDISRNISQSAGAPLSRARTIVRTEAHRIQQASTYDAQKGARAKGADVVKQWDSTLDGDTRPTHRHLDGQIREVDEPFEADGKKAMYPGDFGDPAEDCNCRCVSLTRARWALDEDELKALKDRAEFFGLDKASSLEEFKVKYLQAAHEESKNKYDSTAVNPVIKTAKYRNIYNNLDETVEVQRVASERARSMMIHRSGTKYEDLTFVDSKTGKYLTRDDYEVENEVLPSRRMRLMVTNGEPYTIIAIHNHPGSHLPSMSDLNSAYVHKYKYGLIACHNGNVVKYTVKGEYDPLLVNIYLDKVEGILYNPNGTNYDLLEKEIKNLESQNVLLEVFEP